jgi:hypothetical protein
MEVSGQLHGPAALSFFTNPRNDKVTSLCRTTVLLYLRMCFDERRKAPHIKPSAFKMNPNSNDIFINVCINITGNGVITSCTFHQKLSGLSSQEKLYKPDLGNIRIAYKILDEKLEWN